MIRWKYENKLITSWFPNKVWMPHLKKPLDSNWNRIENNGLMWTNRAAERRNKAIRKMFQIHFIWRKEGRKVEDTKKNTVYEIFENVLLKKLKSDADWAKNLSLLLHLRLSLLLQGWPIKQRSDIYHKAGNGKCWKFNWYSIKRAYDIIHGANSWQAMEELFFKKQ